MQAPSLRGAGLLTSVLLARLPYFWLAFFFAWLASLSARIGWKQQCSSITACLL